MRRQLLASPQPPRQDVALNGFRDRADDLPAYLVLLFVRRLVVTLLLAVDSAYAPPCWVEFAIWIPLTLLLSSALLQPVKGAVVAMQWQMGMHGFAKAKSERALRPYTPNSAVQIRNGAKVDNTYGHAPSPSRRSAL